MKILYTYMYVQYKIILYIRKVQSLLSRCVCFETRTSKTLHDSTTNQCCLIVVINAHSQ